MIDVAAYTAPGRQRDENDSLGQSRRPCAGLRKTIRIELLALFGALCLSTSSEAQIPTEKPEAAQAKFGVAVELVEQGEAAEVAGLQVGDQIVEWSRGGSGATIESPFDWAEVLIEQAPRGSVTLKGWRRGQQMTWSLGLRRWGLVVEPI